MVPPQYNLVFKFTNTKSLTPRAYFLFFYLFGLFFWGGGGGVYTRMEGISVSKVFVLRARGLFSASGGDGGGGGGVLIFGILN